MVTCPLSNLFGRDVRPYSTIFPGGRCQPINSPSQSFARITCDLPGGPQTIKHLVFSGKTPGFSNVSWELRAAGTPSCGASRRTPKRCAKDLTIFEALGEQLTFVPGDTHDARFKLQARRMSWATQNHDSQRYCKTVVEV